jgi:PAS domain S-box-containing protein
MRRRAPGLRLRFEPRYLVLVLAALLVLATQGVLMLLDHTIAGVEQQEIRSLSAFGELAARMIGERPAAAAQERPAGTVPQLNELLGTLRKQIPESTVVLLDSNYAVIAPRARSGMAESVVPLTPTYSERRALERGGAFVRVLRDRGAGGPLLVHLRTVPRSGMQRRIVRIDTSPRFLAELRDMRRRAAMLRTLAAIVAMLLALIYYRHVLQPLSLLRERARSFPAEPAASQGDAPRDEIAFALESFERTVEALQEKERQLAELVAEERARASDIEHVSRFIIDSIPVGVVTVDGERRIITCNTAAGRMLGLANGLAGRPLRSVFRELPVLLEIVERTFSGEEAVPDAELTVKRGEDLRVLEVEAALLRGPSGEVYGVSLLMIDATERRNLEARLRLKKRLEELGEMAAGVAHEFRNPLGAILGFTQLLERRVRDDPTAREYIREMTASIQALSRILDDFLHFVRPTVLEVSQVDIDELVREVALQTRKGRFGDRRIELQLVSGTRLSVDRQLLYRALGNVIQNAFQAAGSGGKVVIRSQRQLGEGGRSQPWCVIQVHDTGPGIPSRQLETIFQPFFTTRPKGTGLGLAIAQKIVLAHDGRITAENDPEGGAVFTIRLPIAARARPDQRSRR